MKNRGTNSPGGQEGGSGRSRKKRGKIQKRRSLKKNKEGARGSGLPQNPKWGQKAKNPRIFRWGSLVVCFAPAVRGRRRRCASLIPRHFKNQSSEGAYWAGELAAVKFRVTSLKQQSEKFFLSGRGETTARTTEKGELGRLLDSGKKEQTGGKRTKYLFIK